MGATIGIGLIVASCVVNAACDSPTQPDSRFPTRLTGTPATMRLLPCVYEYRLARCDAEASWGGFYKSSRRVTTEAVWASSAPDVVAIDAPGVLIALAPGESEITVTFERYQLSERFRVLTEGPPWHVRTSRSNELHFRVVDHDDKPLAGVLVEFTAGIMAGRQAVSDSIGRAIFAGDIACGPFTVRATKEGYHEWAASTILCVSGSSTGPVRMLKMGD